MAAEKPNDIDPRFKSNWKIFEHHNWLKEYLNGRQTYPICIEIDPSNRCPLRCEHCCWGDMRSEHKEEIEGSRLLSLVGEIAALGTKAIIWTGGGDPLANRNTHLAIAQASKVGIESAMFTNGILLNPENTEVLSHNLNWIRFNMAGDNPRSYSAVHRVSETFFHTACSNIQYFCEQSAGRVDTSIGTAINESNFEGLKKLPYLAQSLGVDNFQAKLDFNMTGSEEYIRWWNEVVVPYFTQVKSELHGKVRVFTDPVIRTTSVVNCHAHRIITAITADGRVAFCKMRRDQENTSIGDIYQNTLKDIFDGIRHTMLSNSIHPNTCPILKNFCPYRTTNEAVELMIDQEYPKQNNLGLEPKHINFF